MAELIVKSKMKEAAPDCNVASDVSSVLDSTAEMLIKQAIKRAEANGRKTLQAKDVFVGKHSAKTMLVVKSKIKEHAKKYNVSGDFANALNEMLIWNIKQGAERAKANGRRTLQGRDL
jgi:histone H3/H4